MPAHLFQVRFLSTAAFTRPYGDDIHVRIHNLIQIIFIAVLHLSSVSRKRCDTAARPRGVREMCREA